MKRPIFTQEDLQAIHDARAREQRPEGDRMDVQQERPTYLGGDTEQRFLAKIEKLNNGCWQWKGATCKKLGYGSIRGHLAGNMRAHRIAYELFVGPIPEGLEIDHLCRNRGCVNPDHLEPVTHAENQRRMGAQRTHCRHGHPLSGENLYVRPDGRGRDCRTCMRAALERYKARQRDGTGD